MICDAKFIFCDLIMKERTGVHAKNSPAVKRIKMFDIEQQNPPKTSNPAVEQRSARIQRSYQITIQNTQILGKES